MRRWEMKREKCSGFTLIELLIVVAIIAILAAIAVPNFLEAQVRAKVSRCHADQRTIATAIESYTVDWNQPQLSYYFVNDSYFNCNSLNLAGTVAEQKGWSMLTTPVAYITGFLEDPFRTAGGFTGGNKIKALPSRIYFFARYIGVDKCGGVTNQSAVDGMMLGVRHGYNWVVWGLGPARQYAGSPVGILTGPPTQNQINIGNTVSAYDPSNGTISKGWIMRTNKGIFSVPNS